MEVLKQVRGLGGSFGDERMNNGGGEGIGGVVGLRDLLEMEVEADHFLDLRFMGLAVAADGFFDLVRTVFKNREIILFGDEEANAAGFGDGDAGRNILFEEEFFDRHDVGMVLVDDFVERVIDVFEAVGERSMRRSGDDAVVESSCAFDDAEATDAGARIDA